ncbi:hypothetical protein OMP38_21700 [Cohnella ginsengisoli]|uniref:Uncharacterized protein n=1 Tax=Cohnella ginsengisoli TaxID=425004 RepID=A0A9X4KNZ6_9BACL|nr:hypothetical protein [Cohnella ginsengisoli]MDG0793170.1 hypothetical protein [Cohnella ginsengisoli]
MIKGNRRLARPRRWWPERMESKLIIVFLFLIILPIGVLTYVAAQRYSNSIESNTVTFVSQLSDQMMGKMDDYIEDMKKISIIPSYQSDIMEGLKMSNRFYGGADRRRSRRQRRPDGAGAHAARHRPQDRQQHLFYQQY